MMKINMHDYDNFAEMIDDLLRDEIEETECAISNERIWAKGSDGEQAEQHSGNVDDLEEYKAILQYAIDHGVIYCDKEIHQIWIKNLLKEFVETLEDSIDNYSVWDMDADVETELIAVVNELIETM